MVHYSKVLAGILQYLDAEIIGKLEGNWHRWGAGVAAGLMARRAGQIYNEMIRDNRALQALGVVDGENIDIDAVYGELIKQARQGSITIEIPMIGPVTFGAGDVEALYRQIKGA